MSIELIISSLPSKTAAQRDAMRANCRRVLAGAGTSRHADARRLLAALDRIETDERAVQADRQKRTPPAELVLTAFRKTPPGETDARVIQALLDHPDTTSAALSRAIGWEAQSWHLHFGSMCEARGPDLPPPPPSDRPGKPFWSGVLADYHPARSTFRMKTDLLPAFRDLGFQTARQA